MADESIKVPIDGDTNALAHNGVLYNDKELRRKQHLPPTPIETDSYIAVQLLEQGQQLDGKVSDNRQPTAVSADDRRQRQGIV